MRYLCTDSSAPAAGADSSGTRHSALVTHSAGTAAASQTQPVQPGVPLEGCLAVAAQLTTGTVEILPSLLAGLPEDLAREVLALLAARDLAIVSCVGRHLRQLASEEAFWEALLLARLPRVVSLLEASPPEWWRGVSWKQRLVGLQSGLSFRAQVFNREQENEQEDFLLSTYDADCSLTPASSAALRSGDTSHPLLFSARYLPMGQMPAVLEADVPPQRLRLPPQGSSPFVVFGGGTSASASAGLQVGEEVEVQWKGRRSHPFGWWFGTVQSVRGNRITLVFRQYPRTSVWHRVKAPIKPGREAVVNGDCSFGYVGGLRRLSAGEREEWRRHGAPHPPAPAQLQALEAAAAEEEWSDEEEDVDVEDLDAELAEMEDELDDVLAPAGNADAAAAAAIPEGAAAAAADDPAAAIAATAAAGADQDAWEAAEEEEAVPAPAAPPGQPIHLQLGQVAAAAGAATAAAAAASGAGLPVALAGEELAEAAGEAVAHPLV